MVNPSDNVLTPNHRIPILRYDPKGLLISSHIVVSFVENQSKETHEKRMAKNIDIAFRDFQSHAFVGMR